MSKTSGSTKPDGIQLRRSEIWMVDLGRTVGTELGHEHPAIIVSKQEFNDMASKLGRIIMVPGTSTQVINAQGHTVIWHHQVHRSQANGLDHTTYFMAEQVRAVSTARLRRRLGVLEPAHMRLLENRLCLVMDLFR